MKWGIKRQHIIEVHFIKGLENKTITNIEFLHKKNRKTDQEVTLFKMNECNWFVSFKREWSKVRKAIWKILLLAILELRDKYGRYCQEFKKGNQFLFNYAFNKTSLRGFHSPQLMLVLLQWSIGCLQVISTSELIELDSEKLQANEATSLLLSCFLLRLHPQANPIACLSWNISQHVDCNKFRHKVSDSSTWRDGNNQIEK
jgi:hypothetical protein